MPNILGNEDSSENLSAHILQRKLCANGSLSKTGRKPHESDQRLADTPKARDLAQNRPRFEH